MPNSDSHPWQERITRRLSEIADLPDGWLDGQGDRIDPDALEAARQMLGTLAVVSLALPQLTGPGGIAPTEDGGVLLEWHLKGGAWLSVELTSDGRIEAMSTTPDDKETASFGFLDEEPVASRPNPTRCVASLHIPTTGETYSVCGTAGMQHQDDHPGGEVRG